MCKSSFIQGLALVTLLSACFDVQQADVPADPMQPLLIDNFESGDSLPTSALFGHWFCQYSSLVCGPTSPGFNDSNYAYAMTFTLTDPQNGQLDYPSAQLRTWRRSEARLSAAGSQNLVFWAKWAPDAAEATSTQASAVVSCPGGGDASDAISGIESGFEPSAEWQRVSLPLKLFTWHTWDGPAVDTTLCLTQIDGFGFQIQPTLLDGQTGGGTLTIDNVSLQ
jgi:hypothetical protein